MTRTDLIKYLSDKTMVKFSDCEIIVDVIFEGIRKAVNEDGEAKLRGLGTIKTVTRKSRKARHPITNEQVTVPERRYIRFIPSSLLKKLIRK